MTQVSYGTYAAVVGGTPATAVANFIGDVGGEWLDRVHSQGHFAAMVADFESAINDALPEGVEYRDGAFYGPEELEDDLHIRAIVGDVDLEAITTRHDPDQ